MCTSSRSSGEKEYFDFPPNQNATSQVSLTLGALDLIFLDESGIVTVPPQAKLGPDLITQCLLGIRCWHIWIGSLACVNHYSNHCVTCGIMRPPVQLWWPNAGTRKFCKPSGSTVRPCAHPTIESKIHCYLTGPGEISIIIILFVVFNLAPLSCCLESRISALEKKHSVSKCLFESA